MKTVKALFAASLISFGISAQASYLTLDGAGAVYTVADSNDFKTELGGATAEYDIGSNVLFSEAGNYEITFKALAEESGFFNSLTAYGNTLNETPIGSSFTVFVGGVEIDDLLDFTFSAAGYGSIANGSNTGFLSDQSFATILDGSFDGDSFDAILLWDDSGAGPDDNHDDMIVGVTIKNVSEPATLALVGLGLLGLGVSRKKTAK